MTQDFFLTFWARPLATIVVIKQHKPMEYRNGEKQTKLLGGEVFRFCVSLVSVKRELEPYGLSVPRSDTGAPG